MPDPVKVALAKLASYAQPDLNDAVNRIMTAAGFSPAGSRILVKPNLLMAHPLSCTSPEITASACQWLLDHGAKIVVADSPAFGQAPHAAEKIGLAQALKPLHLRVQGFSRPRKIILEPCGSRPVTAFIAPEALECDQILSIPRIKAHSQLRITLSVKNCFGCLCGLHKALAHAPRHLTLEIFADRVAALWAALPQVTALCDGIIAMTGTGPRNGQPFEAGIIGASLSAPALDNAIIAALNLSAQEIPLSQAMRRRAKAGWKDANPEALFPLLAPEEFEIRGFSVPSHLKNISFNPLVLARSLFTRIWKTIRPD